MTGNLDAAGSGFHPMGRPARDDDAAPMKTPYGLALAAALFAAPAMAQEPPDDEVEVTVMPYGWLAGVSGSTGLGPSSGSPDFPAPDVESDSSGIFDNLNVFGFAVGEVRKGRWGATVDIAYVDFTFGEDLDVAPAILDPELDLKGAVTTVEGFYRFSPAEDLDLDVMGGVKVFWVDLSFDAGGPLGLVRGESEDTWADLAVGGRVRWTPGRWTLSAQADAGVGDDTSDWGVILLADYRVTEHFGLVGGYRWLEFEYGKGDRDLNLTLDGPIVGASWRF